jgi:hypothetical protein
LSLAAIGQVAAAIRFNEDYEDDIDNRQPQVQPRSAAGDPVRRWAVIFGTPADYWDSPGICFSRVPAPGYAARPVLEHPASQ